MPYEVIKLHSRRLSGLREPGSAVLSELGQGIAMEVADLTELHAALPDLPIDAVEAAIDIDDIYMDAEGGFVIRKVPSGSNYGTQ
ncbi:hypothetical protein SAMN05518861_10460 [Mesorhizobium sp. YR577]|nr:hypothetical protein SAMN05518861_10460 [Mesorhizobium sp. YR577]